MELGLKGKRALVCGASQGIGRAVAQGLAAEGCAVALLARSGDKLEAVREGLPEPARHRALPCDLDDRAALTEVLSELTTAWPEVEILVTNTAGPPPGALAEASAEELERGFGRHVVAGGMMVQALLPGMRVAGSGRIINIVSTSAKAPIPRLGVSNTIRGAVASWAKTLAGELGPYGITVNNVLPGFTVTPRLEGLLAKSAEREGCTPDELASRWQATVPLGRFAAPEETAAGVVFLASAAARYITGIHLPIDGGRLPCL